VSDKFEFIDVEYAAYQESGGKYVPSIVMMCVWMEVSRSGFYGWRDAPESATAQRRGELALYVKKSFDDSDGTYGYRRVHADLADWRVPAGPELVRSLMRELGLESCQLKIPEPGHGVWFTPSCRHGRSRRYACHGVGAEASTRPHR
jgi:putative transposase